MNLQKAIEQLIEQEPDNRALIVLKRMERYLCQYERTPEVREIGYKLEEDLTEIYKSRETDQ